MIAALLVALAAAPGPDPSALSLEQALRRALLANPRIGRAQAEIGAADATRRGTLSLILPRVGATGGLIRNSKEVSFGSGEDRRTVLPQDDWNLRLTLQQPVFAGLREQRAYQQSKEALRQAEQGLRAAEDRLLLSTSADYLLVVQAERLIEVETQAIELARKRLAQARDFFDAGEVTQVDVLRAQFGVTAAERRLAAARQARETSASSLRIDLGLDEGSPRVSEPESQVPALPDEATLLAQALRTRPEVAQARSALKVAELEISKQRGAYLPIITADAGYVWQRTSFPADRYGFAALRFSVPLWQSGEVGARVALARERERQARLALEDAERGAREEVRRSLVDLDAARTDEALAREQLAASEAEYRQVFDLYRNQEATSLDLAASENALADARRGAVTTRLQALFALLRVHFAAGDLKAALLPEPSPAPKEEKP